MQSYSWRNSESAYSASSCIALVNTLSKRYKTMRIDLVYSAKGYSGLQSGSSEYTEKFVSMWTLCGSCTSFLQLWLGLLRSVNIQEGKNLSKRKTKTVIESFMPFVSLLQLSSGIMCPI